ncbi:MAG: AAA family ATPase [Phycisphaerae bacterium]|nr:AAA family ATPase [Phycisphaerae bacterium]
MRLIHEITLRNLLSFGPDTPPLPLHDLNVLIGPNGSGKSNLIEAIGLLNAAPTHLAEPVRDGGGIREWLWKGAPDATASIGVTVAFPKGKHRLRHVLGFTESAQKFHLVDERIERPVVVIRIKRPRNVSRTSSPRKSQKPQLYYDYREGHPIIMRGNMRLKPHADRFDPNESIVSQRKDPDQYPEITYLGQSYSRFRLYREWSFGRYTAPRQPQKADERNDFLKPDATNLGLMLNRLRRNADVKRNLLEHLQELYDGIEDYDVSVEGGTVQVFFHESGLKDQIPATRLSDGTLRYLCLLVILCNPDPGPLVCIEEPELGLHLDILPTIAKLLREASEKTQLIVTTHSDILVDALTETPESVVVCEKHEGQTVMQRLEAKKLAKWLEKYRLGELWIDGELGGKRW